MTISKEISIYRVLLAAIRWPLCSLRGYQEWNPHRARCPIPPRVDVINAISLHNFYFMALPLSLRNLKRTPKARILTCTLSVIPLSLWMNSVVERALSDSCCRFCDSSVCNSRNSRRVIECIAIRRGFRGECEIDVTFMRLKDTVRRGELFRFSRKIVQREERNRARESAIKIK